MILFNKLIRTDLILAIALIGLFVVNNPVWKNVLMGFAFATLIFSISNHIEYYKKAKKIY